MSQEGGPDQIEMSGIVFGRELKPERLDYGVLYFFPWPVVDPRKTFFKREQLHPWDREENLLDHYLCDSQENVFDCRPSASSPADIFSVAMIDRHTPPNVLELRRDRSTEVVHPIDYINKALHGELQRLIPLVREVKRLGGEILLEGGLPYIAFINSETYPEGRHIERTGSLIDFDICITGLSREEILNMIDKIFPQHQIVFMLGEFEDQVFDREVASLWSISLPESGISLDITLPLNPRENWEAGPGKASLTIRSEGGNLAMHMALRTIPSIGIVLGIEEGDVVAESILSESTRLVDLISGWVTIEPRLPLIILDPIRFFFYFQNYSKIITRLIEAGIQVPKPHERYGFLYDDHKSVFWVATEVMGRILENRPLYLTPGERNGALACIRSALKPRTSDPDIYNEVRRRTWADLNFGYFWRNLVLFTLERNIERLRTLFRQDRDMIAFIENCLSDTQDRPHLQLINFEQTLQILQKCDI